MKRSRAGDALTGLILEIFRVNGDLLSAGDALVGDLGQTASRWQVLGAVRESEDTVSGIARTMGLARQSVQRTADALAADGIIEFVDNPAHRRAKLVRLTAEGKSLLASIAPRQGAWVDGLAKALGANANQIEDARVLLAQLRTELERTSKPATVTGKRRKKGGGGRTTAESTIEAPHSGVRDQYAPTKGEVV
jgi:DNA-binding MarR family transcriptional regulator